MCLGALAEDFEKPVRCLAELTLRPGFICVFNTVLPLNMIPSVNPNFMTSGLHAAHHISATFADVRPRQQHSIHRRHHAVVANDGSAADFAEKPWTQNALDRTAGVI